jgi:hypothetical protein
MEAASPIKELLAITYDDRFPTSGAVEITRQGVSHDEYRWRSSSFTGFRERYSTYGNFVDAVETLLNATRGLDAAVNTVVVPLFCEEPEPEVLAVPCDKRGLRNLVARSEVFTMFAMQVPPARIMALIAATTVPMAGWKILGALLYAAGGCTCHEISDYTLHVDTAYFALMDVHDGITLPSANTEPAFELFQVLVEVARPLCSLFTWYKRSWKPWRAVRPLRALRAVSRVWDDLVSRGCLVTPGPFMDRLAAGVNLEPVNAKLVHWFAKRTRLQNARR